MAEGLEVVIKYRGAKYHQVASPATPSSEFAILKKDLAHLRVHSPSQKNVRRVNGSFILHWPAAGTSTKVVGLAVRVALLPFRGVHRADVDLGLLAPAMVQIVQQRSRGTQASQFSLHVSLVLRSTHQTMDLTRKRRRSRC